MVEQRGVVQHVRYGQVEQCEPRVECGEKCG